jgi:hypothetical protein
VSPPTPSSSPSN